MRLNEQQDAAVMAPVGDILVSAGAGSGKTKVLVERLLRHLLSGVDVSQVLVLTFTVAAAENMKSRLRARLLEELEIATGEQKEIIIRALSGLEAAHIETLDAYALYLVKKYHDHLGLPRVLQGGADAVLSVVTLQKIDEVFAEHYAAMTNEFSSFLRLMNLKNDEHAKRLIRAILAEVDKLADPHEFWHHAAEDPDEEVLISSYVGLIREKASLLCRAVSAFHAETDPQEAKKNDVMQYFTRLSNVESYDEASSLITSFVLTRAQPGKTAEEKAFNKQMSDLKKTHDKELRSLLVMPTAKELMEQEEKNRASSRFILSLAHEVAERMSAYKARWNLYSFADITHFAVKLMADDDVVAEVKRETKEIFIDEYQDDSDVQEKLISAIASDNSFLVGDVKQSIYRFRNADPRLFMKKHREFSTTDGARVITLAKNYRSRRDVLDGINTIFRLLMSKDAGGVDYDREQELVYGRTDYDKAPSAGKALEIRTHEAKETHDLSSFGLPDEAYEAFVIASDIQEKVTNGFRVFDGKTGTRPARYNDFAILMLTKTRFDLYKTAFDALGVPLSIQRDNDLLDSVELRVITNLVILVASMTDASLRYARGRHALASVLRSFLVRMDDATSSRILLSPDPLTSLSQDSKGAALIASLTRLSALSQDESLLALVEAIYQEFAIPAHLSYLSEPAEADARIKSFLDNVAMLSETGMNLTEFIAYLDKIKEAGLEIPLPAAASVTTDAVRLMSIHKSKGLEFPVVYLSDLKHAFNEDAKKEPIIFSSEIGLAVPYVTDDGLVDSYKKRLINARLHDDDLSEELRKFYVALTRAEEKIIMVTPALDASKSFAKGEAPALSSLRAARSFHEFLSLIAPSLVDMVVPIANPSTIANPGTNATVTAKAGPDHPDAEKTSPFLLKDPLPSLSRPLDREAHHASLPSLSLLRSLALGTRLHLLVEQLDFTRPLSPQVASLPIGEDDRTRLSRFIALPLFSGVKQTVYQEHPYLLGTDRGRIDLLIEREDRVIVIDFKLADLEREAYAGQLARYRAYVMTLRDKPVTTCLYSFATGELKEVA